MKEELVSFETFELAQKKGFEGCTIILPTQSLLQRWLREKHLIFVTVKILAHFQPNAVVGYLPIIQSMSCKNQGYNLIEGFRGNQSYEEALELGLKESLKLLP